MKIIGTVLVLIGGLWMLQGLGIVGGSFMTGERRWLAIGAVTAAAGVASLVWAVRSRGRAR